MVTDIAEKAGKAYLEKLGFLIFAGKHLRTLTKEIFGSACGEF